MKILIADDESLNRLALSMYLNKKGHTVKEVGDGAEVISIVENESFDVILMDVQMPGKSGIEATEFIRKKEKENGTHIYIVALTAYFHPEDRDEFLDAGMDECLTKPVEYPVLDAILNRVTAAK